MTPTPEESPERELRLALARMLGLVAAAILLIVGGGTLLILVAAALARFMLGG